MTVSPLLQIVKTSLACAASGLLLGFASASAAPVTVSNFSFETVGTPDGTGWYGLPINAASWVHSLTNGYQIHDANPTYSFSSANTPDGNNALYLTNAGLLTQNLNTLVAIGDTVSMTFYVGQAYDPSVGGAGNLTASIYSGAALIGSTGASAPAVAGTFTQITLSNILVTTSGNLSISFTRDSGNIWLDAVSVDLTTAPIPEPSSYALLMAAGGCFFAVVRIRSRRSLADRLAA